MSNHKNNWAVVVRTEMPTGDVFIAPIFGRTRAEASLRRADAHRNAPFGVLVRTSRPLKVPIV